MKSAMIKSIILLTAMFTLSLNAQSFCGKVISIKGAGDGGGDWVTSFALYNSSEKDDPATEYNDAFINVTDLMAISYLEAYTKLDLSRFLYEDDLIKKEGLFVCLDRFTDSVRKYRDAYFRYAQDVTSIRIYKDGNKLYEGGLETLPTLPPKIDLEVSIDWIDSGDSYFYNEENDNGWVKATENNDWSGLRLQKVFQVTQLPWSYSNGSASISINKDGLVRMEYSYGDSDAGSDASMTLPKDSNGRFFKGVEPYVFTIGGGDYASGAWTFDGNATITVK